MGLAPNRMLVKVTHEVDASALPQSWLGQSNRVTGAGHTTRDHSLNPCFFHLTMTPKSQFLE